ncbi:DNA mismatch repair protein MutS2 [Dysgonomonas sp. PH5-45]|uniref:lysine 5,6-aminomutase reactivase ATPase KamC n=1 Tax=unclassified Dysgonomonas TaxID=2630389 RepID=UPI002473AEC4|nr:MULTISPECIES: DNA mismatch repair protein MutS [unclassified Dysgonomonas]MDH6353928.1 DNA mismatch repair protein MutS2 [Dysgonomonas sp. PH5-45]MDH6386830.1 DNA mismatch repair protein MutS2 [Dysgonomonas sp. PH5-37]
MLFKEALSQIAGLRYIFDCLNIKSSIGRYMLYETPFSNNKAKLEDHYNKTLQTIYCLWDSDGNCRKPLSDFCLHQLKDIRTTLHYLQNGYTLGDIELFEIKELALLSAKIRREMTNANLSVITLSDLTEVVKLLDPENTGVSQFYVYDAYSANLSIVRKEIRLNEDPSLLPKLREQESEIEDSIRKDLTNQLKEHYAVLQDTLLNLAQLDIIVAKAEFAVLNKLCMPQIVNDKTSYTGLWHIEVARQLERTALSYQPIDIRIELEATVVTGANMAGKSVLLKSLALAQSMAQFGFWIPAEMASIVLVDKIFLCIGDDQNTQQGLSSYAAEMLKINKIVESVNGGSKVLALIDEPARTTNPTEGMALVNALVDFFTENRVLSVITTHYSGLIAKCRRLRVKGFVEKRINEQLSLKNINRFIDYTLVEDRTETVPHEALHIAGILGVDQALLDKANKYLKK